jgi:hypothetical protein
MSEAQGQRVQCARQAVESGLLADQCKGAAGDLGGVAEVGKGKPLTLPRRWRGSLPLPARGERAGVRG